MPDMITPVGTMIKPPDFGQGLSNLSSIINLQQQRQNLQTGQYAQEAQRAQSQQEQQRNRELQAAQAIATNGAKSGQYDDQEGGVDRQKMANDILKVAPTYGQPVISSLLSQANEVVANKRAHQALSQDQQQQMGSTFGSLATKPDLSNTDFVDALNTLTDQNKDPQFKRMAMSMLTHLPPNAPPQQLQQLARRWSMASTSPESATGQTNPAISTMQAPGGLQPINTNPQAAGGIGPVGRPLPQAPGSIQGSSGQILNRNLGTGALSLPGTAGGPAAGAPGQGINQTTAQVETTRGLAQGVTQRVAQAQAAANNTIQAQDALTRAKSILESPDAVNTGATFERLKGLKNVFAGLGIDTQGATDSNSLVKNLARYEAARATQAGLGGTDAARELAHNGSPNTAIDKEALKGIVNQSLATEKALGAYASKQAKTTDPEALITNESMFRSIPNVIEGYEYGMSRNAEEANAFLGKHGLKPSDMAKTRALIKQFESQ